MIAFDSMTEKVLVGVGSTLLLGLIYFLNRKFLKPAWTIALSLGTLLDDIAFIKKELQSNGGGSLKDRVAEISDSLAIIEARQHGFLGGIPRPSFETDGAFNWIDGNPAMERLTGVGFTHLERKRWVSLIHEEDRADVMNEITHAVRDKRGAGISFRFATESGMVPVRLEAVPIFSRVQTDHVICWIGSVSKIDDRRLEERRGV